MKNLYHKWESFTIKEFYANRINCRKRSETKQQKVMSIKFVYLYCRYCRSRTEYNT